VLRSRQLKKWRENLAVVLVHGYVVDG